MEEVPQILFTLGECLQTVIEDAVDAEQYINKEEPFAGFFSQVYPSYLRAISQHSGYYLSELELLAMGRCQKTNVVIVLNDLRAKTLKYRSHAIVSASSDVRWVAIQTRTGDKKVRSHFERIEVNEVATRLKRPQLPVNKVSKDERLSSIGMPSMSAQPTARAKADMSEDGTLSSEEVLERNADYSRLGYNVIRYIAFFCI